MIAVGEQKKKNVAVGVITLDKHGGFAACWRRDQRDVGGETWARLLFPVPSPDRSDHVGVIKTNSDQSILLPSRICKRSLCVLKRRPCVHARSCASARSARQ